ncbi:transmembrane protein, putative [Medicago truncatula]|uniref:Transmembrane protein, putative n=1 Tax=Medicago truncatula TaxID=3880 RepID=G7I808_MEDTR|nr:transmembrane protein, putative [Medicago truncatula]
MQIQCIWSSFLQVNKQFSNYYMQKVDNMAEIPKFSYTLIIFISLFVVITCFRKPFSKSLLHN